MFDIQGKVALVTGGASGIGLATAVELLENGLKGVTIVDISEENGKVALADLSQKYGFERVLFAKSNVARRNELKEAFELTVKTFRNLDIVINGAGIVKDMLWEEEIAVNLGGTITGTYLAFENYLPKNKSSTEGVIVNISSVQALDVFPHVPIYSATKSGIVMLSRCYGSAVHYHRNQVRVMAICPGYTDTPIHAIYPERLLGDAYFQIKKETSNGVVIQPAVHVAKAIVRMICNGRNGSVWVVENNNDPYEINFLSREENKA